MSALLRKLVPTKAERIDTGVVVILVALGLIGFRSSFGGIEFMVIGLVGALLGLLVAHVVDRLRPPPVVGIAAALLVYTIIGGAVALHERAIAGVLPNLDTIKGAARTPVAGWKELITTNPPVGGTGTLLVLPMFSGYVAALSASLLARRTKRIAISLVPIAVVLGLGIVTGTTVPVSIVVQGAVFGSVAVAWLALRNDRRRPRLEGQAAHRSRVLTGVGALLAAALLGWFVGPRLPMADASERTVWRVTVTPPFDPRQYPSPLSNYREYVKDVDVKDSTLFTIDGLPEDTLVRLATMDRYDGLVWRPSYQPDQPATRNSGYFERMGAQIESDFGGKVVTVTVTIGSYVGVWVPDIGEVLSLRELLPWWSFRPRRSESPRKAGPTAAAGSS
jgi:hypothetical protein